MVNARMGLAFVVAALVGLAVYWFVRRSPLRELAPHRHDHHHDEHSHAHHHSEHTHEHFQDHDHSHESHDHKHENKFFDFFDHVCSEFFDMGKYLMFGCIVTSGIQTFLDRGSLAHIGNGAWSSHLFMMGFAFILSLCSTSDAFVASSFMGTFSAGSLLAFLVFGPMLDLKSTLMLLSVFRTRFVLFLIVLVGITVLLGSMVFEHLFLV
jgi:hypothetical protein